MKASAGDRQRRSSTSFELEVSLPPKISDPGEIFMKAKPVTFEELDCSGLLREWPDFRRGMADTNALAAKEGWQPRWFMWPDLVVGYFNYDPDPGEIVSAYRDWRAELELEFSPSGGTA